MSDITIDPTLTLDPIVTTPPDEPPALTPMQVEIADLTAYEGLKSALTTAEVTAKDAQAKLDASRAVVVADEAALSLALATLSDAKKAVNDQVDKFIADAEALRAV